MMYHSKATYSQTELKVKPITSEVSVSYEEKIYRIFQNGMTSRRNGVGRSEGGGEK
jgi:hypothetical protein